MQFDEIRLATTSDLDSLVANDHIASESGNRVQFIKESIEHQTCHILSTKGKIAGYAVLEPSFFRHDFISMVYVFAEFRGKGGGKKLIHHLESLSKSEKLFTSTNESNKLMQNLLFRLGYEKTGIVHNLDEGDPEIIYLKRRKQ